MKTSSFDYQKLKDGLSKLIIGYSRTSRISHFINRSSLLLLDSLAERVSLNVNTIAFGYESWSNNDPNIAMNFKLKQSEIIIIVNRRGYYELRLSVYKPSAIRSHQYLPEQIDELIDQFESYYNFYKINVDQYLSRIEKLKAAHNNALEYKTFELLSKELAENSEVIGFKDRFTFNIYLNSDFRSKVVSHKYGMAFKNKDNMVLLMFDALAEARKLKSESTLYMVKLKSGIYENKLSYIINNATFKSAKFALDFLNEKLEVETVNS